MEGWQGLALTDTLSLVTRQKQNNGKLPEGWYQNNQISHSLVEGWSAVF